MEPPAPMVVGSLIAAIIGFDLVLPGSLVAFTKLREIMPKGLEKFSVGSAKLFQLANIIPADRLPGSWPSSWVVKAASVTVRRSGSWWVCSSPPV